MNVKQVIEAMLTYTGYSASDFLKEVGAKSTSTFSEIYSGKIKNGISLKLARKINARFPEFDVPWIVTGEGVPECFRRQAEIPDEITELLRHKDEQILRLYRIVEVLNAITGNDGGNEENKGDEGEQPALE